MNVMLLLLLQNNISYVLVDDSSNHGGDDVHVSKIIFTVYMIRSLFNATQQMLFQRRKVKERN